MCLSLDPHNLSHHFTLSHASETHCNNYSGYLLNATSLSDTSLSLFYKISKEKFNTRFCVITTKHLVVQMVRTQCPMRLGDPQKQFIKHPQIPEKQSKIGGTCSTQLRDCFQEVFICLWGEYCFFFGWSICVEVLLLFHMQFWSLHLPGLIRPKYKTTEGQLRQEALKAIP